MLLLANDMLHYFRFDLIVLVVVAVEAIAQSLALLLVLRVHGASLTEQDQVVRRLRAPTFDHCLETLVLALLVFLPFSFFSSSFSAQLQALLAAEQQKVPGFLNRHTHIHLYYIFIYIYIYIYIYFSARYKR